MLDRDEVSMGHLSLEISILNDTELLLLRKGREICYMNQVSIFLVVFYDIGGNKEILRCGTYKNIVLR